MPDIAAKEGEVKVLNDAFQGASAAFIIGYQGTKCEELKGLRRKLSPSGSKLAVVKNSWASRAVAGTAAADLDKLCVGPTAVIWAKGDPVSSAKVVSDFAKDVEAFKLKGGVVDGSVVSAKDIDALAKLPSREELLSKLLALINAPATQLLRTINAPAQQLVGTLGAWQRELEKRG